MMGVVQCLFPEKCTEITISCSQSMDWLVKRIPLVSKQHFSGKILVAIMSDGLHYVFIDCFFIGY